MNSNIIFKEHGNEVPFFKKGWESVAQIDNIPEIVEMVKNSNWIENNGYLYSNQYKKYLHRLVMEVFVGEEVLEEYTKIGYVVDHLNNSEPYNCCIDNLHLLPARINKAKGFTVDQDVENIRLTAGIGFYILSNSEYQMSIGFNSLTRLCIGEKWVNVSAVYINFDCFEKCFVAAQTILMALKKNENFNLNHLKATKWEYKETVSLEVTKEELRNKANIFVRDGKVYSTMNNDSSKGPLRLFRKPAKLK